MNEREFLTNLILIYFLFVSAMMAQSVSPATPVRDAPPTPNLLHKAQVPLDYSRYVKRFSSSLECGSTYCKDLNYR